MAKLNGKGKHTVKVGNHPNTNISKPAIVRGGEYKCRTFEMYLKLRDQHLKTIMNIQTAITKPQGNSNQKSTMDIHTKKKKECKRNTKDSQQIIREENKRRKEEKRPTKTNPKQLRKYSQEHAY